MTHSDVIIGHVVTSSVKLHQEAPSFSHLYSEFKCLLHWDDATATPTILFAYFVKVLTLTIPTYIL